MNLSWRRAWVCLLGLLTGVAAPRSAQACSCPQVTMVPYGNATSAPANTVFRFYHASLMDGGPPDFPLYDVTNGGMLLVPVRVSSFPFAAASLAAATPEVPLSVGHQYAAPTFSLSFTAVAPVLDDDATLPTIHTVTVVSGNSNTCYPYASLALEGTHLTSMRATQVLLMWAWPASGAPPANAVMALLNRADTCAAARVECAGPSYFATTGEPHCVRVAWLGADNTLGPMSETVCSTREATLTARGQGPCDVVATDAGLPVHTAPHAKEGCTSASPGLFTLLALLALACRPVFSGAFRRRP